MPDWNEPITEWSPLLKMHETAAQRLELVRVPTVQRAKNVPAQKPKQTTFLERSVNDDRDESDD